jgi:four helix bundle protein
MQNYRQLAVWQKGHAIAVQIHILTESIPRNRNAGIVSQMRRAAQSIPANIVEGSSRSGDRDFAKFVQIAIGSASELEYHLHFAGAVALISKSECEERQRDVVAVRRMLIALLKRLRTAEQSAPR